jgi:hypothetical protein
MKAKAKRILSNRMYQLPSGEHVWPIGKWDSRSYCCKALAEGDDQLHNTVISSVTMRTAVLVPKGQEPWLPATCCPVCYGHKAGDATVCQTCVGEFGPYEPDEADCGPAYTLWKGEFKARVEADGDMWFGTVWYEEDANETTKLYPTLREALRATDKLLNDLMKSNN